MTFQIQFLLLSYGHLLLLFLIGVAPTLLFYRRTLILRNSVSSLLLFASLAMLSGFLLLPFVVFNFAIVLQKNVTELIYPVSAALLVANLLIVAISPVSREALLRMFSDQWYFMGALLFIFFPLAALHILWPLMQHDIVMGYAIGNDGAAYFGAIDGLQSTFWTVSKAGLVLSRPLMQYAMAVTSAFWQVDGYFAYGVTTALVAFLIAAALGSTYVQLAALRNRPIAVLLTFTAAAMIIGVAGTFSTLYYTGTLSQYYGALPVFFALTLPLVNTRPIPLLAWSLFASSTIITMYTLGNIAVPIAITFGHFATYAWIQWRKRSFRHYAVAVVLLGVGFFAAVAIYHYELSFLLEWASSRNLALPYNLLRSMVITLGLYSQYLDASAPEVTYLVVAMLTLGALSVICALLRRNRRLRAYLLLPVVITIFFVAFDSHNLMLTKYRVILFPLIAMSAVFALYQIRYKYGFVIKVAGIIALCTTVVVGFNLFRDFYVPLMVNRHIYVDPTVAKMRTLLLARYQAGTRIYCTDPTAERHTFLRSLFRPYDWQPVRSNSIWPEYSYESGKHPAWIDEFRYDYILDTDDVHGPVNLRKSNPDALIDEIPNVYSLYSGDASNFEFGLEFEEADAKSISINPPVSHFSMGTSAVKSSLFYIHPGSLPRSVHFSYRFTGNEPAVLSIGEQRIATFEPTRKDEVATQTITCDKLCNGRATQFVLQLHDGRFTVDSVWFE